MAIETRCPKCDKLYKLKDELNGKSVKCSNADCRHVFVIKATPKPKAAKVPVPELDAEALADQLFNEKAEDAKPAAERQVAVECYNCNFKWSEPESKAGKNAICPECKTRNKVPELKTKKPLDWRDATGGRRSMEKGPDLPADLEAQQMRDVSIDSMKEAGAIEGPEIEPRPLGFWITLAAVALVLVGGAVGGTYWFLMSGKQGAEDAIMAEAAKGVEDLKDDAAGPTPKDERPLLRAALNIAQGEYFARLTTKDGSKQAVKAFAAARRELEAVPPARGERDALFVELAVAQLSLGGGDEQVKDETRLRWTMQGMKAPPVGTSAILTVQDELRQTLSRFADKGVDRGMRFAALVRLTKELTKLGHPEVLFEIVTQGFDPADHLEAQALMLLVSLRAGGPEDKIRTAADGLKAQLDADQSIPPPWPSVALFGKLYGDKPRISMPAEGSAVPLTPRLAFAADLLTKGDVGEAVKLVTSSGDVPNRLPALAAIAELLDDPKPVLAKAAELKEVPAPYRFSVLRLVRVAADAKDAAAAEKLAGLIADEGLREWALAEAARGKWPAGQPATGFTPPTDPAKVRVGHGWAAMQFARHTAAANRDRGATAAYDKWADSKLKPFGYAGLALGLQDAK